jgi:hypothetical protein
VSISLDEFERRLEAAAGPGGMERAILAALERAGLRGVREARLSLTRSGKQRTGNLRSSIRHEVRAGQQGAAETALIAGGTSGVPVRYAAMQEWGGTQVPKNGKYLAIPVGKGALTPAGVARYASMRDYPGKLRWVPWGEGYVVVDPARGPKRKKPRGEIEYVLKKSVEITGRHFVRDGFDAAKAKLGEDIVRSLAKVMRGNKP